MNSFSSPFFPWAMDGLVPSRNVKFVKTVNSGVANTTTETSIVGSGQGSATIPVSEITNGTRVIVTARGTMSFTAGSPTFNLAIKDTGTTVLSTGAIASAVSVSGAQWEFEGSFTVQSLGVGAAIVGQGIFSLQAAAARIFWKAPLNGSYAPTLPNALAIDVTLTWGAADPGNTLTCTELMIEVCNAVQP